jgi:hypothetical protein
MRKISNEGSAQMPAFLPKGIIAQITKMAANKNMSRNGLVRQWLMERLADELSKKKVKI